MSIMIYSDWTNPSLAIIDAHGSTVLQTIRLLTLHCTPFEARIDQLQNLLLRSIADVCMKITLCQP